MAKQASVQWQAVKNVIDGADMRALQIIANVLNVPAQFDRANTEATKAALRREAYETAKRRAGGDISKMHVQYDSIRAMLNGAISGNAGQSSSAATCKHGLDLATICSQCRIEREANTSGLDAAQAAITGADKEILASAGEAAKILASVQSLAETLERKVKDFGAVTPSELQAMVKAAISDIPARVFEVKRDGETLGKVTGRQHKQFETLLKCVLARQEDGYMPNIWLAGPAGSGKTTGAKNLCKALGLGFAFNGALSMTHEVLGFVDAGGTYHATAFRKAFETGTGYLFDEIDGCTDNSPLLALNAALANGVATFPDAQVERHIDSLIIAGANTFGLGANADYVGRIKLDGAVRDRFPVTIFWDYDEELEAHICGNAEWAKQVQGARQRARAAGLKVLITPRASIAGAALIKAGYSFAEAAHLTYLAPLTADQKGQVA